jgi:opacity protein-like surface antigen
MRLRGVLLTHVALFAAAATAPAVAASLSPPPLMYKAPPSLAQVMYDWSGSYVGVEGGIGWGHSDQTDAGVPGSPPPSPPSPPVADGSYSLDGALLGGSAGYNWQRDSLVFGIEGDFSWANISGSSDVCGPTSPTPHPCGTKLESLGTLRARIGPTLGPQGQWFPYVTGGLAVGEVNAWDSLTPASGSKFRAGWTVGAGVETALSKGWTAKLEYLHVDLGSAQYFDVIPSPPVPETVSFQADIVRVGLNRHF